MRKQDMLDTSEELFIQRWMNGVRVVRPDNFYRSCASEVSQTLPSISVGDLFTMPINVYFLNQQSIMLNVSEKSANLCGFERRKDAIGTSVLNIMKKESAKLIIAHDHKVLRHRSIIFQEQHIVRLDDVQFRGIEIKFPLFNESKALIGILGFTAFPENMHESFNFLMNSGLLAPTSFVETQLNNYPLQVSAKLNPQEINALIVKLSEKCGQSISKREAECLFYLIRGKTARETGIALHLSRRTVEIYLDSLKDKLNCRKKSEIIEKALDC